MSNLPTSYYEPLFAYKRYPNQEGKSVTLAFQRVDGGVNVAFAFLSKGDQFCKATGRQIALARLAATPVFVPRSSYNEDKITDIRNFIFDNIKTLSGTDPVK